MRSLLLLLLLVGLAACDTGEPDPPPPPPPPTGDEVVAGVNLTLLFATPTADEINAVEAEWAQRDAQLSTRYAFSFVAETEASDGATHRVYRGRDALTGQALFYGLIRIPPRDPGDQRVRPLLLTLPDFAETVGPYAVTGLPIQPENRSHFVYALVAYRGMELTVDGTTYPSPSPPSAYDRDADDALAFLAFARSLGETVLIDASRTGVIGLGRGGGVALLTSARTNPYRLVVDLAGPTDLFLDEFRSRVRRFLNGSTSSTFPGFDAIAAAVITPLQSGVLSLEEARLELLRRSPRYVLAPPPYTLVAHGALDDTVHPEHSRVIAGLIRGETTGVYLEQAEADHASLPTDFEVIGLVTSQLAARLGGP